MSSVELFCPQCLGPEMVVDQSIIVGTDAGRATCRLCGWAGSVTDVMAIVKDRGEEFWTGDRVANALLYGATRHAAGPMLQLLDMLGLVPKVEGSEEEQVSAQAIRGTVIKAVLEAIVTSAFETSARFTPAHYQKFSPDLAKSTEKIFSYGEPDDDDLKRRS